jgi:hypothetical protein
MVFPGFGRGGVPGARPGHRGPNITGRDTLRQTRANIELAVLDEIPIRVGTVHVLEDQRVTEAAALLGRLGVT